MDTILINEISILKGIHPGLVLDRKLKERKMLKRSFPLSIGEYAQTISAITKAKRGINTSLALKLEHALRLEESYFMTLQVKPLLKETLPLLVKHDLFKPFRLVDGTSLSLQLGHHTYDVKLDQLPVFSF